MKEKSLSLVEKVLCVCLPIYGLLILAFYYSGGMFYQKTPKRHFELAIYTLFGIIIWGVVLFLIN